MNIMAKGKVKTSDKRSVRDVKLDELAGWRRKAGAFAAAMFMASAALPIRFCRKQAAVWSRG